jgi:hypothetical protein
VINSITIEGDASSLFERRKAQLEQWNQSLDENFPDLGPAQTTASN